MRLTNGLARAGAWITTEYNNQAAPYGIQTLGPVNWVSGGSAPTTATQNFKMAWWFSLYDHGGITFNATRYVMRDDLTKGLNYVTFMNSSNGGAGYVPGFLMA